MPRRTRNSNKLSSSSTTTTTTTTILKPPQNSSARKSNFHNNGLSPQKHNPSEKRSLGPNANQPVSNKISDCKPDDRRILASNEVKGEVEMKKVSILRRSLRLSLLQGTDADQLGSNMTSDCDRRILSSNEVKGR
ncbi:hypothetical protein OIU74_027970 [Salix koriyanagi]|uniref:Uncharacterized protein n=1 Tax=Salix koriyanagi TaxID=2511006 RepID=A0A9Q0ZSF8_9ROSI|nr:hypothetical protein OIU74_027970 [Salix koriyanagi]